MARGSHARIQPALAYDYRRAITLVQLLAKDAPTVSLRQIAGEWGMAIFVGDTRDQLIQRMAEHALTIGREAGG
jgi:hypothetical protein